MQENQTPQAIDPPAIVLEKKPRKSKTSVLDLKKNYGRTTTCGPGITKVYVDAITLGMPLDYIHPKAGISKQTFYNWMEWGEKGQEPYSTFFDSVKSAEPSFIEANLEIIKMASKTQWPAAAWLLERRNSSNFSRNQTRIKIDQKPGATPSEQMMNIMEKAIAMVASGELSTEDAKTVATLIETHRRVAETIQITERVAEIEQKIKDATNKPPLELNSIRE